MQVFGDIAELKALFNPRYAVQVVKHDYQPKSERKYIGTELEAANLPYPRKNWSSVVLWNCGHMAHFRAREQIREAVETGNGEYLHRFSWLEDKEIGDLPSDWNHLVGESPTNPAAKLAHHTQGIPGFTHYGDSEFSDAWKQAMLRVNRGMQYQITVER